jgi:hypothetical protein
MPIKRNMNSSLQNFSLDSVLLNLRRIKVMPAIPDAHGVPYLDVVTLCWLAYKDRETNISRRGSWRSVTGNVWRVMEEYERGPFHAIKAQGLGKTILAFSGTDELLDWADNLSQGVTGLSWQYGYALMLAGGVGCEMVVGHSLGGGLASFVAIHRGIKCATVNPAPLFIRGLPNPVSQAVGVINAVQMLRRSNLVINYVVPGEALDILDIAALGMSRVGKIINVPSTGGWNPIARHLLGSLVGFSPPTRIPPKR